MTAMHMLAPPAVPDLWAPAGPPAVELVVYAKPAPKGSKSFKGLRGGKPVLVESADADIKTFNDAVAWVARARLPQPWAPLDGPLAADVTFTLPRPKDHYRTGKHAGQLKDWAARLVWQPAYPDTDKLLRGLGDALTAANVWADDARLAAFRYGPFKVYERAPFPDALRKPGVVVRLWRLENDGCE